MPGGGNRVAGYQRDNSREDLRCSGILSRARARPPVAESHQQDADRAGLALLPAGVIQLLRSDRSYRLLPDIAADRHDRLPLLPALPADPCAPTAAQLSVCNAPYIPLRR